MSGLGLVLWLFSALLGPARTRSPMFDRLQRRNNSHGQTQKVAGSSPGCSAVGQVVRIHTCLLPSSLLWYRLRVTPCGWEGNRRRRTDHASQTSVVYAGSRPKKRRRAACSLHSSWGMAHYLEGTPLS